MYTDILIPTDGSELAEKAVQHGIALAKTIGAQVTADSGVTATWLDIKRRSRFSRGRSIKRWGPRATGVLNR